MLTELSMEEVRESTASCQSLPTSGREAALRLSSSCSLARLLALVAPSRVWVWSPLPSTTVH